MLHESFAPLLIEMHFLVLCLAFRLLVVSLRMLLADVAHGVCLGYVSYKSFDVDVDR